ncbi:formate hydrogenlyase [Clostridiales bacterium PH28_bin88]|nr:formate hydrogenlyase [Clostridiales bacterium PH28_bin88]
MLVVSAVVQVLILVLLAPLITGIIKKAKAFFQCRQGPGIFQMYYDLSKYWGKETLVSEHTSWIFSAAPYVNFGAVLAAGLMVPTLVASPPLGFAGDVIAVVYLLALGRFFMALAGLDAGHSFGGMGSSREMAVSAMAEPALMVAVFAVSLAAGSTNMGAIVRSGLDGGGAALSPTYLLALAGLMIVALAETGRIPVDNPDTHLELTMIHEGMLLEYTGRDLALMHWAASIKQLLIFSLLANIFFPWGVAAGWGLLEVLTAGLAYLLKLLFLAFLVAVVETSTAKMRLFRVPELLGLSFILGLLALVSQYLQRG